MTLTLGFSPCPNDTFIFDALVHEKIDTQGLRFQPVLEDVQTLNAWAAEGRLDVTKLSFPALFDQTKQYACLDAGAALGNGVGPLLVARQPLAPKEIDEALIAIPGQNTTAHFLLNYAYPQARRKTVRLFSEIEDAVLNGEADLGVLIHENRFTYHQRGLHKIADLGEVWERREGLPIPLGCIAAKRTLSPALQRQVSDLIRDSLLFAEAQVPVLPDYVREHAQAMDEDVMRKHIGLYVNRYSVSLGTEGRAAVEKLHQVYRAVTGESDYTNSKHELHESLFASN